MRRWLLPLLLLLPLFAHAQLPCNTGGGITTIGTEYVAKRAPNSLTSPTRYYLAMISCRVTNSETKDGVVERGPYYEMDFTPNSFIEGLNPVLDMGSASVLVAGCGSAAYAIHKNFRGSITNTLEGSEQITLTFDAETRQKHPVGEISEAPFNGTFTGGFSTDPNDYGDAFFCEAKCACNELKSNGECVEMDVNTSVDWLDKNGVWPFPDNNHDDADRCPIELFNEADSECSAGGGASAGSGTGAGAHAGGASLAATQVGNPINCATGRKVQTETDYRGQGLDALSYLRTYQSPEPITDDDAYAPTPVARSWKNPAIPSFSIKTYADGSQLAFFTIGDRYRRAFYRKSQDLGWETNPSLSPVRLHASSVSGGRAVTTHNGKTYHFNTDGDAVQSDSKNAEPRYFYDVVDLGDAGRQISRIRNRFGDYLNFVYDGPESKLSKLTDQDGLAIHYRYDAAGNLAEVIYPDDSPDYLADNPRKTYLYENEAFPHHLTGIVDQNGQRYATFAYDDDGRAIRTEHASGAERVEVEYPADGEAIVRFYQDSDASLYREEHYTYGQFRGAYRLTSKTITVCQDCTTGTETWDYNSAGLLERRTTPGGQVTSWTYDDQGRKRTETVAAGTPEARTTRYTWNDDWNTIQTVETDAEITTYGYDDQGHRVETTVTPKD